MRLLSQCFLLWFFVLTKFFLPSFLFRKAFVCESIVKKHTNLYKPSYERKDILIQKFALSIFFENFYECFFDFEKRKTGISIAFYQFFVIIAQYFLSEKFSNDCTNAFCTVTDGLYSYWWASNNALLLPLGTQKSRKIYRACGRY